MKNTVLSVLISVFFVSVVIAEPCPKYAVRDRNTIKALLSSELTPYSYNGIQEVLSRLKELAYLGTFDFLALRTQRQAIEDEYQALLQLIDQVGSSPSGQFKQKSLNFISEIGNTSYLEIAGTTLTGDTQIQAEANSWEAYARLNRALERIWICF